MQKRNNRKYLFVLSFFIILIISCFLIRFDAKASSEYSYVDENGTTRTVIASIITNDTTTLTSGWYIVEGIVNTTNLTMAGNVNLILADGCRLTAAANGDHAAIKIINPDFLVIYGQSQGTGTINATGSGRGAGIGGNGGSDGNTTGVGVIGQGGENCGNITIVGGRINTNRLGGGDGGTGVSSKQEYASGGRGGNGGIITLKGGSLSVSDKLGGGNGGKSEYIRGGNGGDLLVLNVYGGTLNAANILGGNGGDGSHTYTTNIGSGITVGPGIAGTGGNIGTINITGGTINVSGNIAGGNAGYTSIYTTSPGNGGNGGAIKINGGITKILGKIGGGSGSPWVGESGGNGSLVITGGLISVNSFFPTPTNGSVNGNKTVYQTNITLEDVLSTTSIKYLFTDATYLYGIKDISTNAEGKFSVWLPSGSSVTKVYTSNAIYSGSVLAQSSGTLFEMPLDVEKPTIVSVNPSDNSVNVPISGRISVTFSEMIDPSNGTISLTPTTGNNAGISFNLSGGTWSSNNTVYSIPYSNLTEDMIYNISFSGFKDIMGNIMDTDSSFDFQIVPPAPVYDITYLDEKGVIKSASALKIDSATKTLSTGWYAIEGTINLTDMTINGNVNLILIDGCKLNVISTGNNAALRVISGNSLSIYGQTLGTGTLTTSSSGLGAGIGGNGGSDVDNCGNLTINGGTIITNRIGGGDGLVSAFNTPQGGNGGNITINAGLVSVSGRIGGGNGANSNMPNYSPGSNGGNGSNLIINGGTIIVLGKIGGGNAGTGRSTFGITASAGGPGTCTITGGSVKLSSLQPSPKNGSANGNFTVSLTTVTLSGISSAKNIKAVVTNLSNIYGTRNMKTDATGKLYLWLPTGAVVSEVFSQDSHYSGSISVNTSGVLSVSAINTSIPVISSISPADGSNNIDIYGNISITFNKVMDTTLGEITLSVDGAGSVLLTGGTWSYSGTVYTVPYSNLSYLSDYDIEVSGFKDISGYGADSRNYTFTTMVRPKSIAVSEQNGELIHRTKSSVTYNVSTLEIASGSVITLNNINNISGITLNTLETTDDMTLVSISTSVDTPTGIHHLSLTIDGVTSSNFNLVVNEAVYGISASQTGLYNFNEKEMGYTAINDYTININNTGNSPTGVINITLTGEDIDCFILSMSEISDIAVGDLDSFGIRPKDNLPIGNYNAIVTISGANITNLSFSVGFSVIARSGNSILDATQLNNVSFSGTNIIAEVDNDVSSLYLNLSVSDGSSWRIYRDVLCSDEITDKTLTLSVGVNIAFVKVTAENGNEKLYVLVITRSDSLLSSGHDDNGNPQTGDNGFESTLYILLGTSLLLSVATYVLLRIIRKESV